MSFPVNVGSLNVYAGDTFSQTFTFKEDDEAIDLVEAGWGTWLAQFRKSTVDTTAVNFAVDASLAGNGQITITLSANQTAALGSNGVFDLQASQSGTVRTWVAGTIAWTKDVTRV
jgi:hypothetical protein